MCCTYYVYSHLHLCNKPVVTQYFYITLHYNSVQLLLHLGEVISIGLVYTPYCGTNDFKGTFLLSHSWQCIGFVHMLQLLCVDLISTCIDLISTWVDSISTMSQVDFCSYIMCELSYVHTDVHCTPLSTDTCTKV